MAATIPSWTELAERLDAREASCKRRLARRAVDAGSNVDVEYAPGNDGPVLHGDRGGFFTHGGERIRYPGAYGRKGFGNMYYQRSTQWIVVGENWEGFSETGK